jgi:uncharacterized integral membrane protein
MSERTDYGGGGGGVRLTGGAIASLAGLAALLVFILQNRATVEFQFLFLRFSWPLWLYTIITAAFGALVWLGLGIMRRHRRRVARREERRD